MKTEALDISHFGLLHAAMRNIHTMVSEYSFANLYLFRRAHNYEIVRDTELFIRGVTYDGATYLMPTADIRHMDISYLMRMMEHVDFLFPVPEEWAQVFDPDRVEITSKDGDMDYVYTVERMSTYKGRRLHTKRHLLRHYTTSYEHKAMPLTSDLLPHAMTVLDAWQQETGEPLENTDYLPCHDAIRLYEHLALCGGIYYAQGEPAGFIIGEEINPETFVLHFAKGLTKFKGVYQYMFNNFAGILPNKYGYMNLEQDLEKETLRVAKGSYYPDRMIKKLRIALRRA